jgi:hypothetical protein
VIDFSRLVDMGILITCDETAPIPRLATMMLTCDAGMETAKPWPSLFGVAVCTRTDRFNSPDGFIAQHRAAMNVGWKETSRGGKTVFLCPECSGK